MRETHMPNSSVSVQPVASPSSPAELVQQLLEHGQRAGLNQEQLAAQAGLRPESLSRAKKRGSLHLESLFGLASAAGVVLQLAPADVKRRPAKQVLKTSPAAVRRSPLSAPSLGLAWSNQDASPEVLIRKALLTGAFTKVLAAAAAHGLPAIRSEFNTLLESSAVGAGALSQRRGQQLGRMLSNIERGFAAAIEA